MSTDERAAAPPTTGAEDPKDEPPLPPLQTAVLDAATLDRLFDDIAALRAPVEVIIKWAADRHTPDGKASPQEARAALDEGRAFGVQLRYPLDGSLWFDTLMRVERGVRLVRIAHPLEAPPGSTPKVDEPTPP